eukprot:gene10858-19675_t
MGKVNASTNVADKQQITNAHAQQPKKFERAAELREKMVVCKIIVTESCGKVPVRNNDLASNYNEAVCGMISVTGPDESDYVDVFSSRYCCEKVDDRIELTDSFLAKRGQILNQLSFYIKQTILRIEQSRGLLADYCGRQLFREDQDKPQSFNLRILSLLHNGYVTLSQLPGSTADINGGLAWDALLVSRWKLQEKTATEVITLHELTFYRKMVVFRGWYMSLLAKDKDLIISLKMKEPAELGQRPGDTLSMQV